MIAVALAVLFAMLFPADVPWICDEPMLIHNALQANAVESLAPHGLMGTQGVQYGPLPTWFYQAYLSFSHNMVLLVTVRALLFAAVLVAALACVARVARLSKWGICLLLFSPSIWLYSRLIWDNTFCIPLSLVAVAFYALFLNGRRWAAGATILACGGLLLVHLMSVPLIAAITLHAVCYRRRELFQARWAIVAALAGVGIAGARYWPVLIHGLAGGGQELHFPGRPAMLFTIDGGQWLSGMGFDYVVGQEWLDGAPAALRLALLLSGVVHLLVLGGAILAGRHIYRVWRGTTPADRVFDLAWVCFATLLIQFVYFGVRGAVDQPHYYNASWFAYGFLAWLALDRMQRYVLGRIAGVLAIALPAACVVMLAVELHRTHGTRALHYGPTLGDQVAVARVLSQAGPTAQVFCEVPAIVQIPQRILVLQELMGTAPLKVPATGQGVVIHFRNDNPRDGGVYAEAFPMAGSTGTASSSATPAAATQSIPITK